jgi:uncharacterized protein (DUF2141 family)
MSNGPPFSESAGFSANWRENHGNFLITFTATILVVGGILLALPDRPGPASQGNVDGDEVSNAIVVGREDELDAGLTETIEGQIEPLDRKEKSISADSSLALQPGVSKLTLLRVKIEGISEDKGSVRVALYHGKQNFNQPNLADAKSTIELGSGEVVWEVKVPADMPVAINAFHDRNNNGELDRNFLGIPSEKYGFSRGARSQRGPPPFEEAAFIPEMGVVEVPLAIW